MKAICTRCAVRLQRAAQEDARQVGRRAFSTTNTRQKATHGVPTFTETSNPELNDVLASMRAKHFVPAYLAPPERRLIFGTKYRQNLADNPQTATIAAEDIPLQWLDRRTEIPNRSRLLRRALALMAASGEGWTNLPALFTGLQRLQAGPDGGGAAAAGMLVRKAVEHGQLGVVLQCLLQSERTGVTLRDEEVLRHALGGLSDAARRAGWGEAATRKARRDAEQVGALLETEQHGAGKGWAADDPRRRPEVIGVWLELAAVYAARHQAGRDVDGKVRSYAERLLSCIGSKKGSAPPDTPRPKGQQVEMLSAIPIWHGLRLAQKILGEDMPQPALARTVVADYEAALDACARALEARNPDPKAYDGQALRRWRDCIRD